MRRRWLLLAVILSAPTGCDNVTWGGVDVRLQAPSTQARAVADSAAEPAPEASLPSLPAGPILLAGTREGDRATLTVVGEVRGDGLGALPTEAQAPGFLQHFTRTLLPPGTELVLFGEGVRVGRLTVTGTATDSASCQPRAQVTGVVELIPGASQAGRLLALTDSAARRRAWGPFRTQETAYEERAGSIAMGTEAIRQVGAEWPPSLVEARGDIQSFRMTDAEGPSVAATFLVGDRLEVAEPGAGAYALFVMGTSQGGAYRASFVGYRPAAGGKGAPRYFSHLDWDGDGDTEVLLDVLGARTRWFASLGQRGGGWVQTFQDPCGTPEG